MHGFSAFGDDNSNDCYGHGTHVSGIVGGLTFGVAKNVTLHAGVHFRHASIITFNDLSYQLVCIVPHRPVPASSAASAPCYVVNKL